MEHDLLENRAEGELVRSTECCAEADNGDSVPVGYPAMSKVRGPKSFAVKVTYSVIGGNIVGSSTPSLK